MTSGLKILHRIDAAISKARASAAEASALPARAGDALLDLQRQQAQALGQISRDRLDIISGGNGGDLGYVDRQAAKLLDAHSQHVEAMSKKVKTSESEIEKLEARRRAEEALTAKAVDAYDKAAARAEADLLGDAGYQAQLDTVERLEATVVRAEEKLAVAEQDEHSKGEPYRSDPFFSYLQKRGYGTREQKGWFLTRWLDGGVARLANYRQAAENYRRLTAIPVRLAAHAERLGEDVVAAQDALQTLEADWLVSQGVSAKHEASLDAQKTLDATDAQIAAAEEKHEALAQDYAALAAGEAGPYQEAVQLMSRTLSEQNHGYLRRLAAQTRTREDDQAVETLRELAATEADLIADQKEARVLMGKYQKTLTDLQAVRQNFKARRYDAPSSSFKREDLIAALIAQVISGGRTGKDLWNQIKRAQRTSKRYSDTDFGGIDWTEGLRLPRTTRRTRRSGGIDLGDIFSSGGFGGGGFPAPSRRRSRTRRTSIPRMPRQSLPRMPRSGGFGGGFGGGRRGGGFKTGGGF